MGYGFDDASLDGVARLSKGLPDDVDFGVGELRLELFAESLVEASLHANDSYILPRGLSIREFLPELNRDEEKQTIGR